jgi:hypothetical protein
MSFMSFRGDAQASNPECRDSDVQLHICGSRSRAPRNDGSRRTSRRSPANLHIAAATFAGATLRGRSEFEVTAARDRAAAALVADALA